MGKYSWSEGQIERREQRRPKPKERKPIKKKIYEIAKISRNEAMQLKIYRVLRKDFLKDTPVCQCGLNGCTGLATEIHHKKGRGKLLNIVEFWLAVCRNCHNWIGANPKEAIKLGLSLSRLNK